MGNGTFCGAGTMDTALPDAGVAPGPLGPEAGVLQEVLTAGAARVTSPVPSGTVVGEAAEDVVVDDPVVVDEPAVEVVAPAAVVVGVDFFLEPELEVA